jgi:uncharacterized protein YueI
VELILLKKPTVEEVLKQGIYGVLETKPEERRKFLGTLRERIIVALYKNQVREKKVYPQIEKRMKENPQAHLFLNGNVNYSELSKYVKLAKKYNIKHTIVTNKEHDTEIGLVLAMEYAIDREEIFITKNIGLQRPTIKEGFFSKFFNR